MRIPAGFVRDIGELALEPDLMVWLNWKNSNFNMEKWIRNIQNTYLDRETIYQNCSNKHNYVTEMRKWYKHYCVFFYIKVGSLKQSRKCPVILVKLAHYALTWVLLLYKRRYCRGFQKYKNHNKVIHKQNSITLGLGTSLTYTPRHWQCALIDLVK